MHLPPGYEVTLFPDLQIKAVRRGAGGDFGTLRNQQIGGRLAAISL
jgi:hypothetical protein